MTVIYQITELCCCCGSCEPYCEQRAILFDYDIEHYVIDAQLCIGCAICLQFCPIDDAIIPA